MTYQLRSTLAGDGQATRCAHIACLYVFVCACVCARLCASFQVVRTPQSQSMHVPYCVCVCVCVKATVVGNRLLITGGNIEDESAPLAAWLQPCLGTHSGDGGPHTDPSPDPCSVSLQWSLHDLPDKALANTDNKCEFNTVPACPLCTAPCTCKRREPASPCKHRQQMWVKHCACVPVMHCAHYMSRSLRRAWMRANAGAHQSAAEQVSYCVCVCVCVCVQLGQPTVRVSWAMWSTLPWAIQAASARYVRTYIHSAPVVGFRFMQQY